MKRIIKIIVAIVLLVVAVLALFLFVIYPLTWQSRETKESMRVLEKAQTTNELAEAVGDLGTWFNFPDGSWMAIRYRDSHSGGVFSSAVAHDSGGTWFHSEHHFCGYLKAYQRTLEVKRELADVIAGGLMTNAPNVMVGFEDIHALASSPDLVTARKNLVALGFKKIDR